MGSPIQFRIVRLASDEGERGNVELEDCHIRNGVGVRRIGERLRVQHRGRLLRQWISLRMPMLHDRGLQVFPIRQVLGIQERGSLRAVWNMGCAGERVHAQHRRQVVEGGEPPRRYEPANVRLRRSIARSGRRAKFNSRPDNSARRNWRGPLAIRPLLQDRSGGPGGPPGPVDLSHHCGLREPAACRYAATAPALLAWFKSCSADRQYSDKVRPFGFPISFQARRVFELPESVQLASPKRGRLRKRLSIRLVAALDRGIAQAAKRALKNCQLMTRFECLPRAEGVFFVRSREMQVSAKWSTVLARGGE